MRWAEIHNESLLLIGDLDSFIAEATQAETEQRRDDETRPIIETLSNGVRDYFVTVTNDFLERIEPDYRREQESETASEALEPEFWLALIDTVLEAHRSELANQLVAAGAVFTQGALAMLSLTDGAPELGVSFDLTNPRAVAFLREAQDRAITQIDDGTKRIIDGLVADAVEVGDSYNTLASKVRGVDGFDNELFGRDKNGHDRADRVAIFEVGNRYEGGNNEMALQLEDAGFTVKRHWRNSGDDRVRPQHIENENLGPQALDFVYPDGHSFGPTDPKCRCYSQYVIEDE